MAYNLHLQPYTTGSHKSGSGETRGATVHRSYQNLEELPQSLRNELPDQAQSLYLAVYQRIWETTAMGGEAAEEKLAATAHEAAMLEVQRRFEKDERGKWVQAPVGAAIDKSKIEGSAPGADEE